MPLTRGRSVRFDGYLHRDSIGAAPSGAAPNIFRTIPARRRIPGSCPSAIVLVVTASPSTLALATRGLRKRYGPRAALHGPDPSFPSGDAYGFPVPNGAGENN